jgi:hypothetical protein
MDYKLALNLDKTSIIKYMMNNPPHCALIIVYSDKCTRIEGAMNSEFLGLQIDHSIMWKTQTIPQFRDHITQLG